MKYVLLFVLILCSCKIYAQEGEQPATVVSDSGHVDLTDTSRYQHFFNLDDPLLEVVEKEEPKEFKKKKPKRKVFYGEKTKRGFTRFGVGKGQVLEMFFYMKEWEEPDKYVRRVYWFDPVKQKIMHTRKYDPATSRLLHGPYEKKKGGNTIEKGIYYKGTKHSRWVYYGKFKTEKYLLDTLQVEIDRQDMKRKEYWSKGWPRSSELTYYGSGKEDLKEVIPYDNQERLTGKYFYFFKNGKIKIVGQYYHNEKVGVWTEYHANERRHFKKTVMVYPDPKKEETFEPYLKEEYDEKGHKTFEDTEHADLKKKKIRRH